MCTETMRCGWWLPCAKTGVQYGWRESGGSVYRLESATLTHYTAVHTLNPSMKKSQWSAGLVYFFSISVDSMQGIFSEIEHLNIR